jgi:F-type H+-transporting ATPase subunit delta
MDYSAIAVRYSKAMFALAEERGILDNIQKDFELIKSVYEVEPEFKRMLQFPVLASAKKIEIFNILFSGKVNKLSIEFLILLAQKRRESYLYLIILDFQKLYKEKKGIKTISFTSVVKISESDRKAIREIMNKKYGTNIDIIEQTDERLIGGFVLRIDDEQYDASVSKHLDNMKRSFKV